MKIKALNLDNKAAGDVELNDAIFGLEPRQDLIQRVVVWQLAKRRSGQHKVLTRGEINRTKHKLGRQKGGGTARHGARSAPLFVGGAKALIVPAFLVAGALVLTAALDLPLNGPIGERTWTPQSLDELRDVYELSMGEGRLDLTQLPLRDGHDIAVRATVGLGQLTVLVPDDVVVNVSAEASSGDVKILGQSDSGFDVSTSRHIDPGERNVTIDLISASGLDLDFFDRLARGKEQAPAFPNYIVRWQRNPNFYLITKITRFQNGSYVSTNDDVPPATLDRIHGMLPTLVVDASGGRIQIGQVIRRPDARLGDRDLEVSHDLAGVGVLES